MYVLCVEVGMAMVKCSAKIFKMYIRASISMYVHGYFQLLTSLSCFMNTNSTLYVHL